MQSGNIYFALYYLKPGKTQGDSGNLVIFNNYNIVSNGRFLESAVRICRPVEGFGCQRTQRIPLINSKVQVRTVRTTLEFN